MTLRLKLLIVALFTTIFLGSCGVSTTDNFIDNSEAETLTDNAQNSQISQELPNLYTNSMDNYEEYVNPYEYTHEDDPKAEMYWSLQRNSIDLLRRTCEEISNKGWIDVKFHYGFPTEFAQKGYFALTDEERRMFLYSITACIPCFPYNDEPFMLVTIGLSEKIPDGKVCCVRYFGDRRFNHEDVGFAREEILSAFNPHFWEAALSY